MSETAAPGAIIPLKRVSAYRTSDGAIHETRIAAELREAELAVDALGRSIAEDVEGGHGSISDFLIASTDEIHATLSRLQKAQKKARSS
jgi:hypothetical protein